MNSIAAIELIATKKEKNLSSTAVRPDWQMGCSELKQRGGHLLQTGQWADCTFLVGEEPHQITIKAHRLILASASPVFEAMFFGGLSEGDGPIRIPDVHPDAFKTVLLYIYTDRTIIPSLDKACTVYYTAKKYMLPYLEKECTWFISLNLETHNVCRVYELAQLFDEKLLRDKCLKIMETRTKEIVADSSFLEIDMSTLNVLLSLEHLSIESELDLFSAIERYAKAHFKSGQYKRRSEVGLDCYCDCSKKRNKLDCDKEESLNCSSDKNKFTNVTMNSEANTSIADISMEQHKETGEMVPKPKDDVLSAPSTIPKETETESHPSSCGDDDVKNNTTVEETMICDNESTISLVSDKQDESMSASQVLQDCGEVIDRDTLREALGKVRFLTLTPAQFAAGPARSPLLSESEAFAVLMNILSSAADVPMPVGFSTSKLRRNQQTIAPAVPDTVSEAVFRFTVLNFKTRRRSVESRPFTLHDAPWTLRVVPRFEFDTGHFEDKYFGLYLKCAKKEQFRFKVTADIRLLAQQPMKTDITGRVDKIFTNVESEWGIDRFVEWNTVLSPERGLLRNNSVTLEARVLADALVLADPPSA